MAGAPKNIWANLNFGQNASIDDLLSLSINPSTDVVNFEVRGYSASQVSDIVKITDGLGNNIWKITGSSIIEVYKDTRSYANYIHSGHTTRIISGTYIRPYLSEPAISGLAAKQVYVGVADDIAEKRQLDYEDITSLGLVAKQGDGDKGDITVSASGTLWSIDENDYSLGALWLWKGALNDSGSTITKGTPVYITGHTGDRINIAPSDASNPATMPAVGIVREQISAGAEGIVIVGGHAKLIDVSGGIVGQTLYVASGGGFTTTKPTYPDLVQNIGTITKDGNNGNILVFGPGRTNNIPNLASGYVFIGGATGNYDTRRLVASDVDDLGPFATLTDGDRGDITTSVSGTVWTVDDSAITYAKIQDVSSTDRILGRYSSGSGIIEEITCTAAGRALLDDNSADDQRATLLLSDQDNVTFAGVTIVENGLNETPLTIRGYSLTGSGSVPMIALSGSWNTSGVPTAIDLNILDTASPSSSRLLNLRVNNSSKLSLSKAGELIIGQGITTNERGNLWGRLLIEPGGTRIANSLPLYFSATTVLGGYIGNDPAFVYDGVHTIAQRVGTNAQMLRIYNTYADANNYERARVGWLSGVFYLGTENAGTGSARDFELRRGGLTVFGANQNNLFTANGYGIDINPGNNNTPLIARSANSTDGGVRSISLTPYNGRVAFNNSTNTFMAGLNCDGPAVLSQRDTTVAQTFRVYNTFTDLSNYERGKFGWNANTLEIGTEAAGTGTKRPITLLGTTTVVPPYNASAIAVSGYVLSGTSAASLVDISATWNTTGSPAIITANITNTASDIASKLVDLRVDGSSKFSVTAGGNIEVPADNWFGTGSAGTRFMPRTSSYRIYAGGALAVEGASNGLSLYGGTVTSSNTLLSLTQTWNNAAVAFVGQSINITNTASSANSKLLDLQVGSVSRLYVRRDGAIYGIDGSLHMSSGVGGQIFTQIGTTSTFAISNSTNLGVSIRDNLPFGFSSYSSGIDTPPTLTIYRDANDTLAQRRGLNPQIFRVYNTYTDASNYERAKVGWNSNVLEIGAEAAGTGVVRKVAIVGDKVGIGTTNPEAKLDVISTDAGVPGIIRMRNTNSVAIVSGWEFAIGAPGQYDSYFMIRRTGQPTPGDFYLDTGGTPTFNNDVQIADNKRIKSASSGELAYYQIYRAASGSNAIISWRNHTAGTPSLFTFNAYHNNGSSWGAQGIMHLVANSHTDRRVGIGTSVPSGMLHIAGYALSGTEASSSLYIDQTWNTTGTPAAIFANITDTASNANSALMNLRTNGVDRFQILKGSNRIRIQGSSIKFLHPTSDGFNCEIKYNTNDNITLHTYNQFCIGFAQQDFAPNVQLHSSKSFGWSDTTTLSAAGDLRLWRDDSAILAQRDAAKSQTYRIYGTYTDTSNYTRLAIGHNGTSAFISEEVAGTGVAGGITVSAASLGGSQATSLLDLTQTWNTTGAPTAIKLNVTDTASNANSLLMDLQVGGTSQFNVRRDGRVNTPSTNGVGGYGLANELLFTRISGFTGLLGPDGGNGILFHAFGSTTSVSSWGLISNSRFAVSSGHSIGWSSTSDAAITPDVLLVRDGAAGILAQRNAANTQTFRVYNTFTDASNYEAVELSHAIYSGGVYSRLRTITAGTGADNIHLVLSPSGNGAIMAQLPDGTATGGNARGDLSVDLQMTRALSTEVASGQRSGILWGQRNTVTASLSLAGGYRCTASGQTSIAIGDTSAATGDRSVAIGRELTSSGSSSFATGMSCTASGAYSRAHGLYAAATLYGQSARQNGRFSSNGDAQVSALVARQGTTDAIPTEMFLDGVSTRITLPNNTRWFADVRVVGTNNASGASARTGVFHRRCLIRKFASAGTTEIIGEVQTIGSDIGTEDGSPPTGWDVTLSADTTNGSLKIEVTGESGVTIRWVAEVSLVEVAYA